MKFAYTAVSKEGKTVKGLADAVNREALAATLANQGLKPVVIKANDGGKAKRGGKVKLKDLVIFTRQLSTMTSAGVPLTRGLNTMQTQTENKYFQSVLAAVTKDVEGGQSLAEAFAKHPSVFSDVYVNMVRAGEAGGILDEILKRLASQVEQDAGMRKKVKSAMTYPTVLIVITIVAFFGIMFFVIPKLGAILKDLGGADAELPVYTQALLNFSDFMQSNAILIFAALGLAVFSFRRYIKSPAGKYKFHAFLLKAPIVKTIIVKIAIARFSRTFASLMSAGVGVLDALEVTGAAVSNKVIEEELKEAAKAIKSGKQLSEPLSHSKHFPPIVAQMLAVGEETGQIDTILIKVADFYEEDVAATLDSLSSIIEPVMIVFLGSMVGVIAISVMGPMASLSQNTGG